MGDNNLEIMIIGIGGFLRRRLQNRKDADITRYPHYTKNNIAYGAVRAIREKGLRVPKIYT